MSWTAYGACGIVLVDSVSLLVARFGTLSALVCRLGQEITAGRATHIHDYIESLPDGPIPSWMMTRISFNWQKQGFLIAVVG